jgi:hypothetical protein
MQTTISAKRLEVALERQYELRGQKLGALLLERKLVSERDLHRALAVQAAKVGRQPLGAVLVEMGLLTQAQIDKALAAQRWNRRLATLKIALIAPLLALAGCSTTATDMVKAYEPTSVLVQWKKGKAGSCGGTEHAYGCARVSHQGAMCVIELPEDAPDWALAHEFKHCFGYVHKHGARPQFAANFGK